MPKIVTILGSTNIDRVVKVPRFATSGETLTTDQHVVTMMGGKGLNQGVAAARSGATTHMITKVGPEFDIEKNMKSSNLDTSCVVISEESQTGQAYITVSEETGDNIIYIYAGANAELSVEDVHAQVSAITESAFVVAQLETPIATTIEAFKIARQHGVTTVLNPAPMPEKGGLPEELLALTDIIAPNEHESYLLTGIEISDRASMEANAKYYAELGLKTVIITLGSQGSFYMNKDGHCDIVPAFKTHAVDTTAAGDTFIGALVTRLNPTLDNLVEAMTYGAAASSVTVSRPGAQDSIPVEDEVRVVLEAHQD
ncbi:ribokinase [Convivina intestini]|uniref:Ribokinase n=1 Tax=Convivina intestini TaxID=1505726 RepID=A0A2U1D9D4_9LACO|nr:ribokinase [Convivina intestini]PVY84290.1 ribokinase [Convivina intestini]CAH1855412.1 Ribokinase [Convivina intestini]SDB93928.1 ribokinase [Leuconostocaceae bacterium R-53105]